MPALQADTRLRTFVPGEGLPGTVWQRRAPVVVEDLWADRRVLRRDAVRADELRTAVAFPVLRGDALLGVCELFSRESRPVPPELLDVLAGTGRQIGQFLARLRAETELRELADTLQRSLLPAHLPTIPGMQLAARYRAGADGVFVGGDTYDVLPLPDGRWMVLIADVCGTGAAAAALTSLTRHTARAAATWGGGPAEILAAVNEALLREQDGGQLRFVTAACLVLERRRGGTRAKVVVAGHPLPLLRAADGSVTEVGVCGRPLGVEPGATYVEVPVELSGGSTLVLYTDGVTEARDDDGVAVRRGPAVRVSSPSTGSSPRPAPWPRCTSRWSSTCAAPGTAPTTSPSSPCAPEPARPSAGLAGHRRGPPRRAWTPAIPAGAGTRRRPPSTRRRASPTASSGRTGSRNRPRPGNRPT